MDKINVFEQCFLIDALVQKGQLKDAVNTSRLSRVLELIYR
jgi:hypothetical protein